jgi:hypothetical protein
MPERHARPGAEFRERGLGLGAMFIAGGTDPLDSDLFLDLDPPDIRHAAAGGSGFWQPDPCQYGPGLSHRAP